MAIQNFPVALQPIIQQGFLAREFETAITSVLGYRMVADREEFAIGIGETLTKTRAGLKPAVTTPLAPNTNTNLDNGLTAQQWGVEQYSLTLNQYGATMDLNMVTSRVGIVGQFLQNAYTNGEQAARSLDNLARDALFSTYLGGNTRVTATLGSAAATIAVDDIRGFQTVFVNGVQVPVSGTNTLSVSVNGTTYTLTGATADGSNVSTAPKGVSGTLTFSGNVSTGNGTAGNAVISAVAPSIIRPTGRTSTAGLLTTDTLTMAQLLDAVAGLRTNGVPTIGGAYNCYLDPVSSRQLFADQDFQRLYQGATAADPTYRGARINNMLGLRFIPTTEAYVQAHPSIGGLKVRRPIIVGAGALIEADFAGMAAKDIAPNNAEIEQVDGIVMVTREPLDRLQQIIAQSWYWIGGFCTPSDTTANPTTMGTATNAAYKRAIALEHVG